MPDDPKLVVGKTYMITGGGGPGIQPSCSVPSSPSRELLALQAILEELRALNKKLDRMIETKGLISG